METLANICTDQARRLPAQLPLVGRDGTLLNAPGGDGGIAAGPAAGPNLRDLLDRRDHARVEAALRVLFRGARECVEVNARIGSGALAGAPLCLVLSAVRDRGDTIAVALATRGPQDMADTDDTTDGTSDGTTEPGTRQADAHTDAHTDDHTARLLARASVYAGAAPWFLDLATGRVTHFPEFGSITGRAPDALARNVDALMALVHPDDRQTATHALDRLVAGETDRVRFELRLRHGDGRWIWCRTVASLSQAANGSGPLICAVTNDVSDRIRAEHAAAAAADELRETHDRFSRLTYNAPGALFEHRRHPDGREDYRFLSATLLDIMGVTRSEVEADPANLFAHVPTDDLGRIRAAIDANATKPGRSEMTHRVIHPVRGPRELKVAVEAVHMDDGGIRGYGSVVDITDRLETERRALDANRALARAHDRLTYLTDGATVGLFEIRLDPEGRWDVSYGSARFAELLGSTRDEIDGPGQEAIQDRVHPDDLPRIRVALAQSARTGRGIGIRFRLNHPRHGLVWLKASAGAPCSDGGVLTWVGALDDVTTDVNRERDLRSAHHLAEQMRIRNEQQALHDGLTGLPNRRRFDAVISDRIAQARAGGAGDCTLVRIDLDRFKHVNDTLGHAAGDKVLVRVAEVMRESVRAGDTPSRNGGDEFSILLATGASVAEAEEVVGRVRRALAEPLIHDGRQCRFGVSFGIAHTDDILATGADLHLFADAALHRAKLDGGNRTEVFTPQYVADLRRDRLLAIDIFEALDDGRFVPFFQPQITAADGSLYGAEVLLRWDHPTDGIIAPGAFMHVAEQLRLVPDIDRVVMEKSQDVLSRWHARGLVVPRISFNVSSDRMHDPDLLARASGFARTDTRVTFELLESILVEEENQAFRDNLDTIRAAGVDIEVDDFGSGHASIIGLMEIGPTALKIDQRIVFPVVHDPRARDLVRAIVDIARSLDIGTIAEGVETAAHARILRELGCGVLQGYHYARPLSEDGFLSFVRSRHEAGCGPGRAPA